jgi:hypothetical protein
MRRLLCGTALLALAAALGCDAPRSRVHGTVTHRGRLLAGAVVTFFGPDQRTYTADTGPDGSYAVSGVPRGAVRVSVQVPPPPVKPRPDPAPGKAGGNELARAEDAAKAARLPPAPTPTATSPPAGGLPARYADPNSSGLSFELKDADQEYAIDLK